MTPEARAEHARPGGSTLHRSSAGLAWLAGLALLAVVAPARASDCFDHYNAHAWEGEGLALVICRNHSDVSRDSYMEACELRHQGGARIQGLSRHGNLDFGRQIFTDYNTIGDAFDFPIDIVCHDRAGRQYVYSFASGAVDDTGCCRYRDCGSSACCVVDCNSATPPPVDAAVSPGPDANLPSEPACAVLPSREYTDAPRVLDVPLGSTTRLTFHVDAVPALGSVSSAALSMVLYDADHPGEEGTVVVNGHSPLPLPASPGWGDQSASAVLVVPVAHLVPGSNTILFGPGTRDRTVYRVSRLSLHLYGAACASSSVDASVPDTRVPDAQVADAARPDTATPDRTAPDLATNAPDVGVADTARTEAAAPPDTGTVDRAVDAWDAGTAIDSATDTAVDTTVVDGSGDDDVMDLAEDEAADEPETLVGRSVGCLCAAPGPGDAVGSAGLIGLLGLSRWRRQRPRESAID